VEPGEVEAVLQAHPAVRAAVVVARSDRGGERRLVAYLVAVEGERLAGLRAHAQAKLPDYMVPAVWVVLPALPMSTSGKVDRQALPDPTGERLDLEESYEPPRTGTERRLAGLWSEVLGLDHVGRQDNFLDLGGHSLLAMKLIGAIHDAFLVELPLSAVFEYPVLATLAEQIAHQRDDDRAEAALVTRAARY
jgi:acyl carrier protein